RRCRYTCALILGSVLKKSYAENTKVGIILHQKTSDLQNALFNNVLGLPAGTRGEVLLKNGPKQLKKLYPKVVQVPKEKVLSVITELSGYTVKTNKNSYHSNKVVIATGYSKMLKIQGLETYIIPHKKSQAGKTGSNLKMKIIW
ncbi:MAG TPA: NAD(P)/FAD-dependent oxidoreductase, partial [Gillisia sp.]|nr:NAD(P)/FAD-dependent oxidoreductase [Gillisia sp.]